MADDFPRIGQEHPVRIGETVDEAPLNAGTFYTYMHEAGMTSRPFNRREPGRVYERLG